MRLTTVILIASLMQVSASTLAQKITLSKTNAPLKTILQELRQQSGYLFLYSDNVLKLGKLVDIEVNEEDFNDVLEKVFANQPLTYSINKKTIVIKEKEASLVDVTLNLFQRLKARFQNIKGRVTDEQGKPLPNASIQVQGKPDVYMSSEKGEFEINGVANDAKLIITYVGYKVLIVDLKNSTIPLEIKLNQQTGELQEVKISYNTGYQELDLKKATGSVVQIDNELFNRAVGANVLERIFNVTSGLIYAPGGLTPGKTGVVIRGISTINAGTDPLIVVDNFPYEGDLNNLNPNNVESITVLKDAAASSIWGVRAGNGVIVVTTKKGKFNQPISIGFNSNLSISQKPDLFYIPYMSSRDIIDFEKQQFSKGIYNIYDDLFAIFDYFPLLPQSAEILLAARKKNNGIPNYNALDDPIVTSQLDKLAKHDVRNDINKYLLENKIDQQYALNLSGGGNNFNYYASIGYDKNKGNNIKEEYKRISLNFTNTWRPIKNLDISTSLVHTRSANRDAGSNYNSFLPMAYLSLYTMFEDEFGSPLAIPYGLNRTAYVDTASYPGLLDWHYRPLEDYKFIDNQSHQYDTRISAQLNYRMKSWLKAEFQYQNQTSLLSTRNQKGQGSFFVRDRINSFMTKDASGKISYPFPLGDLVEISNGIFKAWNIRGSLKFDQQFGNHQVSAFVGMELREVSSETNFNTMYGYDSETFSSIPVSFTQSFPTRPSGSKIPGSIMDPRGNLIRNGSFFGNGEYSFKGRYLVTVSGRIDQSNFFGVKANLRRVPLWSTGVAWNLHLEDFYNVDWLNRLKLKASYGYAGNTNSGASSYATFKYLSGTSNTGAPLMSSVPFGNILTPNNPQLSWERVKIANAGIEFELYNNRINGSLEFYQKRGVDLLGPLIPDPTTGVDSYTANDASIKGNGVDFNLRTCNLIEQSFEWATDLFINFNKDKVTSYSKIMGNTGGAYVQASVVSVGDPLYSLYSYPWAGLNPKTGDPQIYLGDTVSSYLNLAKIQKEDLVFNGQLNPKIFGSVRNTIRYRQISFSANVTYQFGHYFRKSSIHYSNLLNVGWSGHADYAVRWQKHGDEFLTNVPSFPTNVNDTRDAAYLYSTALVEKADHVRLQDIRLDYKLDKKVFRNLAFRQVSFYLFAQNLGIIWRANKKGLDPNAYSFGSTPAPKTVTLGLNANF